MFNVNRRKIVSLILSTFLLIEWMFYSGRIKLDIPQTDFVASVKSVVLSNQIDQQQYLLTNDDGDSLINTAESIITKEPTSTTLIDEFTIEMNDQHEFYQVIENYSNDKLLLGNDDPPFKRILFWNKFQGNMNYGVGHGRDALLKSGCPVWQCETSDNRTDVENYDAVLIHLRTWNKNDLPKRRSPHQRYVFFNLESAAWHGNNIASMSHFFNWTMTYRWDSDMVRPYGYITPTGNVPLHPSEDQMKSILSQSEIKINYAQGKTRMAAWLVSNCRAVRSNRNELVKELAMHNIQVDVYGKCGMLKCPKKLDEDNSSEECRDMVAKNYKFYLALENSLCRDYVTEKFFENMRRPILPVVFGLHDDHEKLAPPHSFVNAAKFENVKKLADYLILLDRNDTLYNEYFWWKDHFQVRDSQRDRNQAMCHLCAALHDPKLPPKIYDNLTDWWETQSNCDSSPVIS